MSMLPWLRIAFFTAALPSAAAAQSAFDQRIAHWRVIAGGAFCIAFNRPSYELNATPFNALSVRLNKQGDWNFMVHFWPKTFTPQADGCVDCLKSGDRWFHLRLCLQGVDCGQLRVGIGFELLGSLVRGGRRGLRINHLGLRGLSSGIGDRCLGQGLGKSAGKVRIVGIGLGNGAIFKLVPQYFPTSVGSVTGLVGAAGGLGGFFPPLLLGTIRQSTGGFSIGFILLSGFALLCLFICWTMGTAPTKDDGTSPLLGTVKQAVS